MFTQDENSTACSKCGGTWILTWENDGESGGKRQNHGMIWMDGCQRDMFFGFFYNDVIWKVSFSWSCFVTDK